MKALVKLHDRLLRGRKLVVTYANAAPADEGMYQKSRRVGDSLKPTTLSLLKAQRKPQRYVEAYERRSRAHTSADAQIAAMEAKLAAMQRRPDREPTPERLAADELEAEIRRELEADANRGSTTRAASRDRDAASISTAASSPAAPSPAALSTNSPLPSATSSPKPPVLSGIAGLPPKPVVAPLSPRRWERGAGEDRSPRRRWDDTPRRRDDRSPRDRSPRRREDRPSPRRDRDRSPPPRRRDDRSPRDYSPRPSDTFQRGLALLPKKPAF